eukprot:1149153-Pelagomonas_calceolata.AAC.1
MPCAKHGAEGPPVPLRTSILPHYNVYVTWGEKGNGGEREASLGKGGWGAVDTPLPAPRLQANVRSNCSSNLELFRTVGELILSNRPTHQP